jgi:hypothetical protein
VCAASCLISQVTPHPACKASITVNANTTTGEDEFFVTGAAVVPYSDAVPVTSIDTQEVAAGKAPYAQLPFAWP